MAYPNIKELADLAEAVCRDSGGVDATERYVYEIVNKFVVKTLNRLSRAGHDHMAGIFTDIANDAGWACEHARHGIDGMVPVCVYNKVVATSDGRDTITHEVLNHIKRAGVVVHKSEVYSNQHWMPEWVYNAVQMYTKNDGFAGLKLQKFIRKMSPDRKLAEPSGKSKKAPTKIKHDRHAGKNEYRPKNRHRGNYVY